MLQSGFLITVVEKTPAQHSFFDISHDHHGYRVLGVFGKRNT